MGPLRRQSLPVSGIPLSGLVGRTGDLGVEVHHVLADLTFVGLAPGIDEIVEVTPAEHDRVRVIDWDRPSRGIDAPEQGRLETLLPRRAELSDIRGSRHDSCGSTRARPSCAASCCA